jgi:excisionase family DNA binding protein
MAQLLTVRDLAGQLQVCERTIRRRVADGTLPTVRLGRTIRRREESRGKPRSRRPWLLGRTRRSRRTAWNAPGEYCPSFGPLSWATVRVWPLTDRLTGSHRRLSAASRASYFPGLPPGWRETWGKSTRVGKSIFTLWLVGVVRGSSYGAVKVSGVAFWYTAPETAEQLK